MCCGSHHDSSVLRRVQSEQNELKSFLLKNYQSLLSLCITSSLESTPSLTSSTTSWFASSWLTILPWSSHLVSVTITTLVTHHPIILSFQSQNFSSSQIIFSIDIWHPLGWAPRLFGPAHSFNFFLSFQFFRSFSFYYYSLLFFISDLFSFFFLILVFFISVIFQFCKCYI